MKERGQNERNIAKMAGDGSGLLYPRGHETLKEYPGGMRRSLSAPKGRGGATEEGAHDESARSGLNQIIRCGEATLNSVNSEAVH